MKKQFVVLFLIALQLSSAFANWGLLSVFDPGDGNNQGRVSAMEQWQGKQNALQLVFTTYDDSEQTWLWPQLTAIWNTGHVPIIAWEPWFKQAASPLNIASLIASGQYDTYLQNWGANLRSFIAGPDGQMNTNDDRRAFMRFAHEFNGNWYPWSASAQSTPQDYINMWRHVQNLITSIGVDRKHLQWIWSSICCEPAGVSPVESYFVGNDYIDWIGIGGFNFGTTVSWSAWYSAQSQFSGMVTRMRTLTAGTKPLGITEVCSVSQGGDKNTWLTDLFSYAEQNNIRMISYFNLDKDESGGMKDWAIFGGMTGDQSYTVNGVTYTAASGYKTGLSSNYWIGSNPSLPSHVSDNMFYGIGTCAAAEDCLTGYSCSSGVCTNGAQPPASQSNAPVTPSNSKIPASNSPVPPSQSKVPPSSAPSQSKAPASVAPSQSKAPASVAPSQSKAPASVAPSQSKAPASVAPSQSKAPASVAPSQSNAPSKAPASQSKAPASAAPSQSKAPSSSKVPVAPSKPVIGSVSVPVPSPSNATVLNVYKTGAAAYSISKGFGGHGTSVVFDARGIAPEGATMIQVKTVGWGGFGLYNPSHPINVSRYQKLYFSLASSAIVKVEIQDSNGKNFPIYVPNNRMSWRKYSITLNRFTGVNLNSINGEFIITMETTGRFQVDDIYFM